MSNNEAAALMQPYHLGPIELPHRIVMAPLTRSRANPDTLALGDLNAEYYRQRASAALVIGEATQISPMGQGYPGTPGIYSDAQRDGWKQVVDAVHDAGGRIFAQLWHVGRISHPSLLPGHATPVAPSAIQPKKASGTEFVTPRALDADELPGIVADYKHAAQVAKDAGFDGVEVHNANGYLLDQFLRSGTNVRTDDFGGSVENRMRFPLMVVDAVLEVWNADRVGCRVSPIAEANDIRDADPAETFGSFARALDDRNLIYLHVTEPDSRETGNGRGTALFPAKNFRGDFKNTLIANGGYDRELALKVLSAGDADLIAFGRPFISNPDLPERLFQNAPLTEPDTSTFYGGDAKGYTDYPTLA